MHPGPTAKAKGINLGICVHSEELSLISRTPGSDNTTYVWTRYGFQVLCKSELRQPSDPPLR